MKQVIYVKNDELDFFNETAVSINVDDNVKILSTEPYVAEMYKMYKNYFKTNKADLDFDSGIFKATISSFTDKSAIIDINPKYSTVLDLTKEKAEYVEYIKQSKELDFRFTKTKKGDVTVSFSGAVSELKRTELLNSIGQKVAYKAIVRELVTSGGFILTIDGIEVFMPGSLASMNKLSNFEELVGKTLYVCPINYSDQFNKIVVSHRDYLKSLKPIELDKVKYDVKYVGKITGSTHFGIFAEFNTTNLNDPLVLTGLIPTSEMDAEMENKFNKRQFKDGDLIDFYVKFISDKDGNKIILTKHYINWDEMAEKYKQNTKISFTIIKIEDNIIFGNIDNTRLIGTISNYDGEVNVGQSINLLMSKFDEVNKRVFLKTL